jgi:manganese-dependent inorganic pyrophosphatase
MQNNIYIIGHKSPDLDSVAAAIVYAEYKNITEKTDKYIPAVAGEINKETKFALEKFNFSIPKILENAKGKELIFVDHNEMMQAVEGAEEARIHEVLDHHKVNFNYSEPIKFNIETWGASCTIVAKLFFDNNMELDSDSAGLLLSAILIDTVISKSPTCTSVDIEITDSLAKLANISDWREYGMELFGVRSDMSDMSDAEVIKSDFKDFEIGDRKIGIGQVETADLSKLKTRKVGILSEIEKIKKSESYFAVILFITDIINEGSLFLVKTDDEDGFRKAFGELLKNNEVYIKGIISRKKQVAPKLIEVYKK